MIQKKPTLVDYKLFKPKPKPIITKVPKTLYEKQQDLKLYINIFFVLLILAFCIFLYYRKQDKEKIELEKKQAIYNLYNLVHDNEKISID
jgi:hypothetical protein